MIASRTIMIMAGGTGGHIFPALSVAEHLRAQGWSIVWLGARTGMEATLVAPEGYTMAWISMTGVRGKGALRFALLPLDLLIAFWQSARAIFAQSRFFLEVFRLHWSYPMKPRCGATRTIRRS